MDMGCDETEIAVALIRLLPVSVQAAAMSDVDCGEPYGSAVLSLGDLAATGQTIPIELVEQIKRTWPNDGAGDLDDLLHERLAKVTPTN